MSARRLASALVLGTIGLGTWAAIAADASSRPPARMLVYAQEWSLWPSRTSLPAGRVIVQLWNRGQDAHDVRIRRLDARGHMTGVAQTMASTQSGAIGEAGWRLKPGSYELYCSLAGHFKHGMHVKLRVR